MDLQADSALETMAQSASGGGALTLPSTSSPEEPTQQQQSQVPTKGFPKEIMQGNVEEKFLCGFCDLILRRPVQSECGHRFCGCCKDAMTKLTESVMCKACIKEGVSREESILDTQAMFDDKAATREMKKIPTKCVNPGCQWKGTFLDYSTNHEISCDKKQVVCSLCGVFVVQSRLFHHETKACPKRTIACQHCQENMLFEQQEKHHANCPRYPVRCEKCAKQVPRSELKTHKDEECIHRIIECPVPDCNTKLPLEQFPAHFSKTQQSTQKHMLYLFNKIVQLEKDIAQMENDSVGAVGGASGGTTQEMTRVQLGEGISERSDVAGAEGGTVSGSALAAEDKQKLKLFEDLMAVLHGEILRCIRQVEALNAVTEKDGKIARDGQRKIESLERSMGHLETRMQELLLKQNQSDPYEHGSLSESGDCTVTWRIDNFTQVRRAACQGGNAYINSPSFTTSPCGYKLRLRFFADGDGDAKGKAFSAFIQLQKGTFDDLLIWPFTGKVFFMIMDIAYFKDHKIVSFSALPEHAAFKRPNSSPNTAAGCPQLLNLKEFSENLDRYLVHDSLFLRASIHLPDKIKQRMAAMDMMGHVSSRR